MWTSASRLAVTRTFAGVCSFTCLALLALSLLCLENFRSHLRERPSKAYSHPSENEVGISRTVSVPSAVRCDRIELPWEYHNASSAPYNPGAIRHPRTGEWLLVFTYDECWYRVCEYAKTGEDLEARMRSHPLLLRLGTGAAPDYSMAATSATMLELDAGFDVLRERHGQAVYKAADWRPFAWRGEVYLGHWTAFMPIEERMSISLLDVEQGVVRFLYRFHQLSEEIVKSQRSAALERRRGIFKRRGTGSFKREKNWGFVAEGDALLVYYSLLPCTVVLQFDTAAEGGVVMRLRACYEQQAASIARATGLDMGRYEMHTSGHPVPWDVERGAAHRELVSMLHVRHGDYAHWGVRIDRTSRRITHVSAGPIVKSLDVRNEGFLSSALVVSSFAVLDLEVRGGGGSERVLQVLYGEGDRFGCVLDIPVDRIVWHAVDAPAMAWARPVQQSVEQRETTIFIKEETTFYGLPDASE
ncbi:hypothetical protein WJX81_003370 [Elliptochloris bilobata]|uniref:Uncharacterized protein n=1 Tax=Elliptochloris bilobata TaxID=381761 RepID=A0AAW1QCL2_9CHLO